MARYNFSAEAEEDMREIGRYTKKTWGVAQARQYRAELKIAFEMLAQNPEVGRRREEVATGVRSFKVAAHIAFYATRKEGVTVLRLLHPSMDVEAAFNPDAEEPGKV